MFVFHGATSFRRCSWLAGTCTFVLAPSSPLAVPTWLPRYRRCSVFRNRGRCRRWKQFLLWTHIHDHCIVSTKCIALWWGQGVLLKITRIYYFRVLGVRSWQSLTGLKPRCQRGHVPSGASKGKSVFVPAPASGSFCVPGAHAPATLHCSNLCFCCHIFSTCCLSLVRTLGMTVGPLGYPGWPPYLGIFNCTCHVPFAMKETMVTGSGN